MDRRADGDQHEWMVAPALHTPSPAQQVVQDQLCGGRPFASPGATHAGGPGAGGSAKRDGRWKAAYASQRTITIPQDLRAALVARPRAMEFFQTLDSKNRYAILYRLQDAKKAETRLRRLQKFVRMLEAGETLHVRREPESRK